MEALVHSSLSDEDRSSTSGRSKAVKNHHHLKPTVDGGERKNIVQLRGRIAPILILHLALMKLEHKALFGCFNQKIARVHTTTLNDYSELAFSYYEEKKSSPNKQYIT